MASGPSYYTPKPPKPCRICKKMVSGGNRGLSKHFRKNVACRPKNWDAGRQRKRENRKAETDSTSPEAIEAEMVARAEAIKAVSPKAKPGPKPRKPAKVSLSGPVIRYCPKCGLNIMAFNEVLRLSHELTEARNVR